MSSRALRAGALAVLAPAYLPEGPRVKECCEAGAAPGVLAAEPLPRAASELAAGLSAELGPRSWLPRALPLGPETGPFRSGEVELLPGRGILQHSKAQATSCWGPRSLVIGLL